MGDETTDGARHLWREKMLYRYHWALKHGNFPAAAEVLRQAQHDPTLERMVLDHMRALADAQRQAAEAYGSPGQGGRPEFWSGSGGLADKLSVRPPQWWAALDSFVGSTLRWYDLQRWRPEQGYSAQAVPHLKKIYHMVGRSTPGHPHAGLNEQLDIINGLLGGSLAPAQRLRALYMGAVARNLQRDYADALDWLAQAIDLVPSAGTSGDQVDLLYLHGLISRSMGMVGRSARSLHDCLGLYHESIGAGGAGNPAFEVSVLVQLAAAAFFLAQYQAAEKYLEDGRTLLRRVPVPERDATKVGAGTMTWVWALLLRWRRQPNAALQALAQAMNLFETSEFKLDAARLYAVAADVAIDIAQDMPPGSTRDDFVDMAEKRANTAGAYASQQGDIAGVALADLAQCRIGRVRPNGESRVALISRTLDLSEHRLHGDIALRAQALTAMGDEYGAEGKSEEAADRYRAALAVLEGSEMAAMGAWARRGLLMGQEGL